MSKLREIDAPNPIIENLGSTLEVPAGEVDILEALKQGRIDYYEKLKEEKKAVAIRFTGLRRGVNGKQDELYSVFENLEIVYPLRRIPFQKRVEATVLLDKEYVLYVNNVSKETGKVYFTDGFYETRRQAISEIGKKLDDREEIYLRGRILGLQKDGGEENSSMMACYVDIGGVALGLIPIKKWSVGFSATESFREMVNNNIGSIVNFRVTGRATVSIGKRKKPVFVCSRKDYLEKIGYDPWKSAEKSFSVGSTVKVRIVEEGKSKDSFFGAVDGIFDLNMLCFLDGSSDLSVSDIQIGYYYYGFVQKFDVEKRYLRIRLTKKADFGSEIKQAW